MRIAALYDIHGNLPALEAALAEVRRSRVERVVIGGDVVPGPMPGDCLALLRELEPPVQAIRGNGEAAVLAARSGADPGVPEAAREEIDWTAAELAEEDVRLLAGWPATLELEVAGLGRLLFCHATPRSDTEIFTRLTRDEEVLRLFAGVTADLVVCGHTHIPFDRTVGRLRIVNAGSVGMPFGRPGADWLLLDGKVRPRHTDYDLDAAVERIAATSYPDARRFAERQLLHPPSEQEMLRLFADAEPTS